MCIVSGSYQSIDSTTPKTVVELWCRAEEGHSVVLLVHGLRPYFDIAIPGAPRPDHNPDLDSVVGMSEVVEVSDPVMKWTRHGMKRHWRVYANQPYSVRNLRKKLDNWEITSADILFVNRLMLDLDLGPHISAGGSVLWAGGRAPDDSKDESNTSSSDSEKAIIAAGGAGLYPVDMVISCGLEDLEKTETFPAPFVSFSFDLETSISTNRILCAAAVVDRDGDRSEYEFKGPERDIMEGLTRLVRDEDPDFITGYNIDNFDLPRMQERAEVICPRPKIDRLPLFGWGPRVRG